MVCLSFKHQLLTDHVGTQCPRWHSFPSPIDVGSPNPPPSRPSVLAGTPPCVHPLRGSAFSLTHCPVSSSDTICNSSSPQLTDIVLFGLSLKVFKTRLLGGDVHTLVTNVLFSSLINVGSHNPLPSRAQCPHRHLFPSPIDVGPPNSPFFRA